jgi:hypothetical protein
LTIAGLFDASVSEKSLPLSCRKQAETTAFRQIPAETTTGIFRPFPLNNASIQRFESLGQFIFANRHAGNGRKYLYSVPASAIHARN